jgi:hypothetical protein
VTVFKQSPSTHVHVRTPIMVGVVVLMVVLLSAFCYYRTSAFGEPRVRPVAQGLRP